MLRKSSNLCTHGEMGKLLMKGSGYNIFFFSLVNGSGWLHSLSLLFGTFFWSSNWRMEKINCTPNPFSSKENVWVRGNISKTPREVLVIISSCVYVIMYYYLKRNIGIISYVLVKCLRCWWFCSNVFWYLQCIFFSALHDRRRMTIMFMMLIILSFE